MPICTSIKLVIKKLRKSVIPCEAAKKFNITLLSQEFRSLNRLERVPVSKRILFKKVAIMPKGKSPKQKGSMCNTLTDEVDFKCKLLPRPADSNGFVIVKLKRRLLWKCTV